MIFGWWGGVWFIMIIYSDQYQLRRLPFWVKEWPSSIGPDQSHQRFPPCFVPTLLVRSAVAEADRSLEGLSPPDDIPVRVPGV